jgi:hypothetical protein
LINDFKTRWRPTQHIHDQISFVLILMLFEMI